MVELVVVEAVVVLSSVLLRLLTRLSFVGTALLVYIFKTVLGLMSRMVGQ
jgi:hypothetical protein